LPVDDVQGDQGEDGLVGGEADRIGGAGELALQGRLRDPGVLGRHDQLTGQPGGTHALAVEDERQSLVVALAAAGDVGDQERPPLPEHLQHGQECLGASADLLHGDDVEAAHHLDDAQQVAEVADG
jgi:hypothetical protein